MTKTYPIAVFPGDGIGPEVIAEGKRVLDAAAAKYRFRIDWREFPHGAQHYLATGRLLTAEDLAELSKFRAIFFGACGDERVPPGILEKGLVIALRMHFDQFVNLRPIRLLPGIRSPLRDKSPEQIDFVVVRENTEDFYVAAGGRCSTGRHTSDIQIRRRLHCTRFGLEIETSAAEIAYQLGMASAEGCQRVIRYAFALARCRRKKLALVDKVNVLTDMYAFWREHFAKVAAEFPDVETEFYLIDAATMWFVREPERFDVVVAPNMFGDILTDLGAAIQGSLGLAPGANIHPDGTSMFEPIHGSAPPLQGRQVANPIASIWAGSMMLDFLGEGEAAAAVLRSIEQTLAAGNVRTPDLGGTDKTADVGDEVVRSLQSA
jgi:tartrate dehydrogenase/decarboxylase / D-malate dehydrogenase